MPSGSGAILFSFPPVPWQRWTSTSSAGGTLVAMAFVLLARWHQVARSLDGKPHRRILESSAWAFFPEHCEVLGRKTGHYSSPNGEQDQRLFFAKNVTDLWLLCTLCEDFPWLVTWALSVCQSSLHLFTPSHYLFHDGLSMAARRGTTTSPVMC